MGFVDAVQKLKENTVRDVNLSGIPLNDENIATLAIAIVGNTSMQTLYLSRIQLPKQGHKALAQAVFQHPSLRKLDFSNNGFDSSPLYHEFLNECILECKITTLCLSGNSFGHVKLVLSRFTERCPRALQTFDLSDNKLENDDVKTLMGLLELCCNLLVLNLSSNKIESKGAEMLATFLRNNPSLVSLNLANNRIGNKGGKALANALKENRKLNFLNLSANRLEDESAFVFAEMIQVNASLLNLNLDADSPRYQHTPEKFSGKGTFALANALKANVTLIAFTMNFHKLNPEAIKLLVELQSKPQFISLHARPCNDNPENMMILKELILKNQRAIKELLESVIRRQDEKTLRQWLDKGIHPLITNDDNDEINGRHNMNTALHFAARCGWEEGVQFLLGVLQLKKLDPFVKNIHAQTALDLAKEMAERAPHYKYQNIIKLLEGAQYGNVINIPSPTIVPSATQPHATPGELSPLAESKGLSKIDKKHHKKSAKDSDDSYEESISSLPLTQRTTLLERRVDELEKDLKKVTAEKKKLKEQVANMQGQLNQLHEAMQKLLDKKPERSSSSEISTTLPQGFGFFEQQTTLPPPQTSASTTVVKTPAFKSPGNTGKH